MMMAEDTKVVVRDGQWLGSGDLFADYGNEEVVVALDDDAAAHSLLRTLPDNEPGSPFNHLEKRCTSQAKQLRVRKHGVTLILTVAYGWCRGHHCGPIAFADCPVRLEVTLDNRAPGGNRRSRHQTWIPIIKTGGQAVDGA